MKASAKKPKVIVTLELDEDEAVDLMWLCYRVRSDGTLNAQRPRRYHQMGQLLFEALHEVKILPPSGGPYFVGELRAFDTPEAATSFRDAAAQPSDALPASRPTRERTDPGTGSAPPQRPSKDDFDANDTGYDAPPSRYPGGPSPAEVKLERNHAIDCDMDEDCTCPPKTHLGPPVQRIDALDDEEDPNSCPRCGSGSPNRCYDAITG